MNVDVSCPKCETVFTVRRELLGKRTKCPRCETAFTIAELPAAQPPIVEEDDKETAPPEISVARHRATSTETPAARRANKTREWFDFDSDAIPPRFPALKIVARSYEIMAVLVLAVAAMLFVMFLVALIRAPGAFLAVLLGSGLTFFWAALVAVSLLAFAQAIRLGLQIEENTRETQAACRRLADHLTAIETEP